ncbi:MAG: hypothetical protein JNJ65_11900 [Cyclobacteriaceae bacterium]|nr:hypothetical protein [Cyclobacteriaceae bacterium]
MKRYILISFLMICLTLPGLAQQIPTRQEESDPKAAGLKRMAGGSHQRGLRIQLNEEAMEASVEAAVENAMVSVESALRQLEHLDFIEPIEIDLDHLDLALEPLEIEIPELDFDIEPIKIELDELDLHLDFDGDFDHDRNWEADELDEDHDNDKHKDKNKSKHKEKSKTGDKFHKPETHDKAKGLKKLN